MGDKLSAAARKILDLLPLDGSSATNQSLRKKLGWDEPSYWPPQWELRQKGYADASRGRGGKLRRLDKERQEMLARIPASGAPVGNQSLRDALGWPDEAYWRVRDKLIDEGLIEKGRGRGGSVYRVLTDSDAEPAPEPAAISNEYRRERTLYPDVKRVLETDWAKDERYQHVLVEVTAEQGRRETGGKWTRPDLTMLSLRRFVLTNQRIFDVTTFEVKRSGDWDVDAIYEAHAHSARATYSYAFFHHEGELTEKETTLRDRCRSEAIRLGVGLITCSDPKNFDAWQFAAEAVRHNPAPEALEDFVATQIERESKDAIVRWW